MTQASSAQLPTRELAWKPARKGLTLAQQRANFAAQMRAMALSDLEQVSKRLKGLHVEWEREDGRRWTHYELAAAMKIAPRTFQSWENGEVENTNGKGYDKIAAWYSRRLGRKITRNWIVFGCDKPQPVAKPSQNGTSAKRAEPTLGEILDRLEAVLTQLDAAEAERGDLKRQLDVIEGLLRQRPSGGS